jgi:hypothetical protein
MKKTAKKTEKQILMYLFRNKETIIIEMQYNAIRFKVIISKNTLKVNLYRMIY